MLPAETGAKLFPGFSGYGRKVTTNSPELRALDSQLNRAAPVMLGLGSPIL